MKRALLFILISFFLYQCESEEVETDTTITSTSTDSTSISTSTDSTSTSTSTDSTSISTSTDSTGVSTNTDSTNLDGTVLKDVNGNIYKTVVIGDQVWMAENLKVTKYNDGSPISVIYYDNDVNNVSSYGALYNWYTVTTKICPVGWHVPSDAEWTTLTDYIGSDAGTKLKSISGWDNDGNGTDDYGFSGVPGGLRSDGGNFKYIGSHGTWWSSTPHYSSSAWLRSLDSNNSNLSRIDYGKVGCFSVRCIKD